MRTFLCTALAVVALLGAQPAHAGIYEDCDNSSNTEGARVNACTEVANSADASKEGKAAAYAKLCYLYILSDLWYPALEYCQKANELVPLANNYTGLGRAKFELCWLDEAQRDFDKALEMDPTSAAALYWREQISLMRAAIALKKQRPTDK
jgi:tetratricopeptide (TPR) repeat protein